MLAARGTTYRTKLEHGLRVIIRLGVAAFVWFISIINQEIIAVQVDWQPRARTAKYILMQFGKGDTRRRHAPHLAYS